MSSSLFLFCSFSVLLAMSAPWCCLFFAKIQQIGGYILQIYKYYVIFAWILNKMLVSVSAAPGQKGVLPTLFLAWAVRMSPA